MDVAARLRRNQDSGIPRLEGAMPPMLRCIHVGNGAPGVVVEARHLPGLIVPSGSIESHRSQIVVAPMLTV
jgi:hypothetical protein